MPERHHKTDLGHYRLAFQIFENHYGFYVRISR
jgi:hypothetical protein